MTIWTTSVKIKSVHILNELDKQGIIEEIQPRLLKEDTTYKT